MKIHGIMTVPSKEDESFIIQEVSQMNIDLCNPLIGELKRSLSEIKSRLKHLWTQDDKCRRLMQIMLSVMGIGPITALQILIHTIEFKSITNARAFASFCGVAPFEYGSGTSVKKATRVSHYANKRIKSLLHTRGNRFDNQ
ncbi:transposase [Pedobacter psychrotolerans]|uniref:transposase n=1 Tax=Pedobacter psychrotolerans TaxID=1843235 RepID=UPI003F946090